MLIKFISLTIRNFLSYGNNETTIQLDRIGTTLVSGEDLDNTSNGKRSNGTGKAQPLHCKIKTPTGWTTMGQIQVGDLVTAADGSNSTVLAVFPQGNRPTYRITFSDGRSTEADKDHLWSVFSHMWGGRHNRGNKTLTTVQLKQHIDKAKGKKKAWYNVFVPLATPQTVDDAVLPLDPYLLGCLLGDGSMVTRNIMFSNANQCIIERVNNLMEYHGVQLVSYNDSINYCTKSNHSRDDIADVLSGLQLIGRNSYDKFIPTTYLNDSSVQQKIALLQGLIDTDGTVGKSGDLSFSSSSKQLALDVQYLVRAIGGKATISCRRPHYMYKGERKEGHTNYNVAISYYDPQQLVSVDYKKQRLSINPQYSNSGLRITDIEYIGEQQCQCIAIDHPSHLYVTDDFIVTHNTTWINALTYALYGRPLSNISLDKLINNVNKKNMEVTLEFEVNDQRYMIKRGRKVGSNTNHPVYLYHNGQDITSAVKVDQKIQEIIMMPFDIFVRTVVFSATHEPFLKLPSRSTTKTSQAEIIEELFGLTDLTRKAELLKKVINDSQKCIDLEQVRIDAIEQENVRRKQQLENVRRRAQQWQETNQQTIISLQSKLNKIESVNVEEQRELHGVLQQLNNDRKTFASAKSTINTQLNTFKNEINRASKELKDLQNNTCPYCQQHFNDTDDKINQCNHTISDRQTNIDRLQQQLIQIDNDLDQVDQDITSIKALITVDNVNELIEIQTQKQVIAQKIVDLEIAVNPHTDTANELNDDVDQAIDYSEINRLTKLIEHQKFLLKLLTKKDSFVRKTLLNRNIPLLNQRLQHYLLQIGMTHKVEFTHEMTTEISKQGYPLDFENLSAGQQASVNLALMWAFRSVRQSMHCNINICLLDEVLDIGLDPVGVQNAARMLKLIANEEQISVYVISHREEIEGTFDRNINVQMSKGFSSVVQR